MPSILKVLRSAIAGRRPTGRSPGELYVNEADKMLGVVDSGGVSRDLLPVRYFSPSSSYVAGDVVRANGALWRAQGAIPAGGFNPASWVPLETQFNVGVSPPSNPVFGDVWIDSGDLFMPKYYDGAAWEAWARRHADGQALVFVFALTLRMSPTGSANPANPLGGDPFNSFRSLYEWVQPRFTTAMLTVDIASGTYPPEVGPPIMVAPQNCNQLVFSGKGKANTLLTFNCPLWTYIINVVFTDVTMDFAIPNNGGNDLLVSGKAELHNAKFSFADDPSNDHTPFSVDGELFLHANTNNEVFSYRDTAKDTIQCDKFRAGAPSTLSVVSGAVNSAVAVESAILGWSLTLNTPGAQKRLAMRRPAEIDYNALANITLQNGAYLDNHPESGTPVSAPVTNGHSIPFGPYVLQWGFAIPPPGQPKVFTVNFPVAFAHSAHFVMLSAMFDPAYGATDLNVTDNGSVVLGPNATNASFSVISRQFHGGAVSPAAAPIGWFALGH